MEFLKTLLLLAATALLLPAADEVVVQWKSPSPQMPWLESVALEGAATTPLSAAGEYPNGLRFTLPSGDHEFRVKLAHGYGFTFSTAMLAAHPILWVRDLGIFISTHGDWTATAAERAATARQVEASYRQPFESAAEQYFRWTGFTEHEPDDIHRKIWDFVRAKQSWPPTARNIDRVARLPEADTRYFTERVPDLKYSSMFLGWPDHDDQFILWNNGRIGISSQSVGGDPKTFPNVPWLPRAQGFTVQFATGPAPNPPLNEFGQGNVRQSLEDGHRLVTTSQWSESGVQIQQTSFAYPLDGETPRTGIEPMVGWNRVSLTSRTARTAWMVIEFTDTDSVTYMDKHPLQGLSRITWQPGGFFLDGRLIAAADRALTFEALPTLDGHRQFRAAVPLKPGIATAYDFGILYRPIAGERLKDVDALGFTEAHTRMKRFWDRIASRGASITVPDAWLNNLYRTFLPRILECSHIDPDGHPVLHTSPVFYSRVWSHITASGIAGDLARRGQFDLCRKYFEALFRWQDTPAPDAPGIKEWKGFFGLPAIQAPMVWMPFHGRVLWAAGRYYQLSGDRVWLDQHLPALLSAMQWTANTRALTKQRSADGSRPVNYGWMPSGRVSDGKGSGAVGTGIFTDSNMWLGLDTMAAVLAQIHHPDAARWREEADAYRRDIIDGERRSSAERPLALLNDGTWVPYLPGQLGTKGHEYSAKYGNIVDGAWAMGIMDTGVYPAGAPEFGWMLSLFEDAYTPLNPSLADEPYSVSGMGSYLAHDQIPNFLYTFYSLSTNTLARQTLTTFEHRSWGQKRVFELTPWSAGIWTTAFTEMLCRTNAEGLDLLTAIPRRWLANGQTIQVKGLQTEFGPVTFTTRSAQGAIETTLKLEPRQAPRQIRLRLRTGRALQSVTVDGKPWTNVHGEWITLPGTTRQATVVAR